MGASHAGGVWNFFRFSADISLYLLWNANRKPYPRKSGSCSTVVNDLDRPLNPDIKVTPLFDAEYLKNSTRYRHSFNGILIRTYTRPIQQCHFKWPWVTAKYSMTQSIAWSLCDSWASCSQKIGNGTDAHILLNVFLVFLIQFGLWRAETFCIVWDTLNNTEHLTDDTR